MAGKIFEKPALTRGPGAIEQNLQLVLDELWRCANEKGVVTREQLRDLSTLSLIRLDARNCLQKIGDTGSIKLLRPKVKVAESRLIPREAPAPVSLSPLQPAHWDPPYPNDEAQPYVPHDLDWGKLEKRRC